VPRVDLFLEDICVAEGSGSAAARRLRRRGPIEPAAPPAGGVPRLKKAPSQPFCTHVPQGYLRANQRFDGKWVITSNDDTLTTEDLALGYKQLMRVEECWRSMKSGLRMRPVHHWAPHRIEAHVKLCVLGLLLQRISEIRSGDTWRNVVAQLEKIKVVEYIRGETRVCQTTNVRPEAQALLSRLQVPAPPRLHRVEAVPPA